MARPKTNPPAAEARVFRTLGIDVTHVRFGRKTLCVREVGGAMQNLWPQFLVDCRMVAFVADASEADAHDAVRGHLTEIFTLPELKFVPAVVVLAKCDLAAPEAGSTPPGLGAEERLGIPALRDRLGGRLAVIRSSLGSPDAARELLSLMRENAAGPAVAEPPRRPARPHCCHSEARVPGQPETTTASSPLMSMPSSSALVVATARRSPSRKPRSSARRSSGR